MSCFPCTLQLKYREVYEKSKAQINMDPEAHEIRAAKEAYKNITNVRVFTRGIRKNHFLFIIDSRLTQHTFLILAWLQEEIWSHEKQVDLDSRQTRLPQCCQELPAAERCELVLPLYYMCDSHCLFRQHPTVLLLFCLHRLSTSMTKRWWKAVWSLWLMTS